MLRELIDPLKNTVQVAEGFCDIPEAPKVEGLCSHVEETILKPAMVFQDNTGATRYYYRAVNWNTTLLIETRIKDGVSEAVNCILDPATQIMQDIIKRSKLLFENN